MRIYKVDALIYRSFDPTGGAEERVTIAAKNAKAAIAIAEKKWSKESDWNCDEDGNDIKTKPKWHVTKVDVYDVHMVTELDV